MTGERSRGRPPDSEDQRWQRAQIARRTVDEELAAMQREGLITSPGKAIDRAARRLGISTKTLKRLLVLAPAVDPREEWLRELKQAELDELDELRREMYLEDRLLAQRDSRGDA